MRWRRAGMVLAAVVAVVAIPATARACSQPAAPTLESLLDLSGTDRFFPPPDTLISGIYEQEHIAEAPMLLIRDVRITSVVTRYWGTAPANLGREMHGEATLLLQSSCGNRSGRDGDVGYNWVSDSTGDDRFLPYVRTEAGIIGKISPSEEAALEDRFGPPIILEVDGVTRAAAYVQLWWLPMIVAAGLVGLAAVVARHFRRMGLRGRQWVRAPVIAGFVAAWVLIVAHPTTPDELHSDFLGSLAGFAGLLLLVRYSRPSAAVLCAFLGLRNISATLGAVGNNEFLLQLPALDRLMLAGALVLAGFAVQAVAERHWIRPLGSLAILGGLPLAAMATAVSRGWTQKPGVLAVGAVAFGAAAAWVWWIDRHDVRAALARRPSPLPQRQAVP